MSQSIDSEQDELYRQFLGRSTASINGYFNHEPQFLLFEPLLDTIVPRFQDSQEPISPYLFYQPSDEVQSFLSPAAIATSAQHTLRNEKSQDSPSQEQRGRAGRRREKNSNAIKKIGRIILDNLREYRKAAGNTAVCSMLKLLSKNSKVGRTEVNKRDKFNTYHLRALFGGKDAQLVAHNLRTTRAVLSSHLRQNVLGSRQISDRNKALYLNTMKCSVLRCSNRALAVRLQMAAEQ